MNIKDCIIIEILYPSKNASSRENLVVKWYENGKKGYSKGGE